MNNSKVKTVLIKLGGSLLTHENRLQTLNESMLERLINVIGEIARHKKVILIHGAGSYGHPLAKEFRLQEGYQFDIQKRGVVSTHESMLLLNKILVQELNLRGVYALSFPAMAYIQLEKGRIKESLLSPMIKALELGFTPVTFGDVAFDSAQGFRIISGDQLLLLLGNGIPNLESIVVSTDVDGVFLDDPDVDPKAELLKEIPADREQINEIFRKIDVLKVEKREKVTGTMKEKLLELIPVANNREIPIWIVNGKHPKRIKTASLGGSPIGTLIRKMGV